MKKRKLPKINWQKLKSHKPQKLRRRTIIILAINAALLLAMLICIISYNSTANKLLSQDTISRWAPDSELRYAQVSCFVNAMEAPTEEQLYTFAGVVDSKLVEASIAVPEDGKLWTYAYSAIDTLTVKGSYGSSTANAFGVGGDYFLFHPLSLLSGSYFASDDLMDDHVLLDKELAWRLFGSTDLAGMIITINEIPFYISGVIDREDDEFSQKAYDEEEAPRIYLSYTALQRLNEKAAITCYEIVLPSPIVDFGLNIAKENFPLGERGEAIKNSGRFSLEPSINNLINFNTRTINSNEISYPYWENAARLVENSLAWNVFFIFLFSLFPIVCLIYLIVKEIKHVKHFFKKYRKDI